VLDKGHDKISHGRLLAINASQQGHIDNFKCTNGHQLRNKATILEHMLSNEMPSQRLQRVMVQSKKSEPLPGIRQNARHTWVRPSNCPPDWIIAQPRYEQNYVDWMTYQNPRVPVEENGDKAECKCLRIVISGNRSSSYHD
jgi:hypothetical protein